MSCSPGPTVCLVDLILKYPVKALLSIGVPAVLWADLALPQKAPVEGYGRFQGERPDAVPGRGL